MCNTIRHSGGGPVRGRLCELVYSAFHAPDGDGWCDRDVVFVQWTFRDSYGEEIRSHENVGPSRAKIRPDW